jgi:hypothetical protein
MTWGPLPNWFSATTFSQQARQKVEVYPCHPQAATLKVYSGSLFELPEPATLAAVDRTIMPWPGGSWQSESITKIG